MCTIRSVYVVCVRACVCVCVSLEYHGGHAHARAQIALTPSFKGLHTGRRWEWGTKKTHSVWCGMGDSIERGVEGHSRYLGWLCGYVKWLDVRSHTHTYKESTDTPFSLGIIRRSSVGGFDSLE
jgi:hypothetical protein